MLWYVFQSYVINYFYWFIMLLNKYDVEKNHIDYLINYSSSGQFLPI